MQPEVEREQGPAPTAFEAPTVGARMGTRSRSRHGASNGRDVVASFTNDDLDAADGIQRTRDTCIIFHSH